jgi:hypothetical protein
VIVINKQSASMQRHLYRRYCDFQKYQKSLPDFKKDKSKAKLIKEINKKNTTLLKIIKWLEERGVSFDKPVPLNENLKRPEPFRVTKQK